MPVSMGLKPSDSKRASAGRLVEGVWTATTAIISARLAEDLVDQVTAETLASPRRVDLQVDQAEPPSAIAPAEGAHVPGGRPRQDAFVGLGQELVQGRAIGVDGHASHQLPGITSSVTSTRAWRRISGGAVSRTSGADRSTSISTVVLTG